jgi:hypothetical protein
MVRKNIGFRESFNKLFIILLQESHLGDTQNGTVDKFH